MAGGRIPFHGEGEEEEEHTLRRRREGGGGADGNAPTIVLAEEEDLDDDAGDRSDDFPAEGGGEEESAQKKANDDPPSPTAMIEQPSSSSPSLQSFEEARRQRRGRHGFQTRAALLFAAVSAAALAGLAAWSNYGGGYGGGYHAADGGITTPLGAGRYLEDNGGDGNGDGGGGDDWSSYSCDAIFALTEPSSSDQCSFAKTCNGGEGLYISFVFCNSSLSVYGWCLLLSPLLLTWLVTLFRMLGTTAEDYFSPSLEMFSLRMGLPPRFAGVTLLALGNGAADVSATVSAFLMDPERGYQMSLGALTGAGMFVGTVVAGVVIVTAEGVPCRGALVRDVAAFLITTVVVYVILKSGSVGKGAITTFFAMYAAFVTIVLIADVYHRAVVVPRLAEAARGRERERQEREGRLAAEAAADAANEEPTAEAEFADEPAAAAAATPASSSLAGSGTLDAALANEEATEEAGTEMSLDIPRSRTQRALRGASIRLMPGELPPGAVSADGRPAPQPERVPIRNRALNRVLMALSNYDRYERTGTTQEDPQHGAEGWGVDAQTLEEGERPVVLHGRDGVLNRHGGHNRHNADGDDLSVEGGGVYSGDPMGSSSPYSAMVDQTIEGLEGMCAEDGTLGFGAHSWRGAFYDGREELRVHARETWRDDIMDNEENSKLDKFLLICELPFTVLRKLSVPIPCEGYYCRALVALSLALSPLWLGTYFLVQYEINLWWAGGVPYIPIMFVVFVVAGALVLRYAPGGDANMALFVSGPIAFYGFVVAATWIDAIADQLVGLLGFLGVILHIPGSVMGLTVLAWGNSMGDLSANMTMARKGLANMAITACFAGPVFNILIGLGGGFSALSSITGEPYKAVTLTPSIETGFFFLLCNCVLLIASGVVVNKGRIPSGYGYAALALYLVYVVTSLVLQFTGFGGGR